MLLYLSLNLPGLLPAAPCQQLPASPHSLGSTPLFLILSTPTPNYLWGPRGCKPQTGHAPIKVIPPATSAWLCEEMGESSWGKGMRRRDWDSVLSPRSSGSEMEWGLMMAICPLQPLPPPCTQIPKVTRAGKPRSPIPVVP